MRIVGEVSNGNVIVEMTPMEYQAELLLRSASNSTDNLGLRRLSATMLCESLDEDAIDAVAEMQQWKPAPH